MVGCGARGQRPAYAFPTEVCSGTGNSPLGEVQVLPQAVDHLPPIFLAVHKVEPVAVEGDHGAELPPVDPQVIAAVQRGQILRRDLPLVRAGPAVDAGKQGRDGSLQVDQEVRAIDAPGECQEETPVGLKVARGEDPLLQKPLDKDLLVLVHAPILAHRKRVV